MPMCDLTLASTMPAPSPPSPPSPRVQAASARTPKHDLTLASTMPSPSPPSPPSPRVRAASARTPKRVRFDTDIAVRAYDPTPTAAAAGPRPSPPPHARGPVTGRPMRRRRLPKRPHTAIGGGGIHANVGAFTNAAIYRTGYSAVPQAPPHSLGARGASAAWMTLHYYFLFPFSFSCDVSCLCFLF